MRTISGLLRGFSTCCLRFTNGVAIIHAKLASSWLAGLYREGVEPSGSRRKVSDSVLILLSWTFPDATKIDFCGRGMTVATRRNAHRAQNGVPINWSLLRVTIGLRGNSGIAILPGRRAEWP